METAQETYTALKDKLTFLKENFLLPHHWADFKGTYVDIDSPEAADVLKEQEAFKNAPCVTPFACIPPLHHRKGGRERRCVDDGDFSSER